MFIYWWLVMVIVSYCIGLGLFIRELIYCIKHKRRLWDNDLIQCWVSLHIFLIFLMSFITYIFF